MAIPHLFNLDTLRWRRGPQHGPAILSAAGWTTWDDSRRMLWVHSGDDGGGNAFIGFHPDGDNENATFGHWTDRFPNKLPGIANHNAMPADPAREIVRLRSIGSKPLLRPFAALEYAPNIARLVYFSPWDDGIVHTIARSGEPGSAGGPAGEWSWHAHRPDAGTLRPIADAAGRSRFGVNLSHTCGRFRVASIEGVDVAILVRHVDSPMYAWRMN